MRKEFFLLLLPVLVFSCISGDDDNSPRIASALGECLNASAKKSVIGDTGKILFSSTDSLRIELAAVLACLGNFTEKASISSDTTLKITYSYGNSGTGCVCRKTVTISVSSNGYDLDKIRQVDFNGRIYGLEKGSAEFSLVTPSPRPAG